MSPLINARQDGAFLLDDRSLELQLESKLESQLESQLDSQLESQLESLRRYCALIPFENGDGLAHGWDEVLYAQDMSAEKLAAAARQGGSGDMLPHQALLLAFFAMLKTPRDLFNTFAPRHREMYYRELLGMKERAAVPDRVVLAFMLDEQVRELYLDAGLRFDAGLNADGVQNIYRLDQPLLVNRGRLTDLRWTHRKVDGDEAAFTVMDGTLGDAWPVNGLDLSPVVLERARPDRLSDAPALPSRVLASHALVTAGGKRTITFELDAAIPADVLSACIGNEGKWIELPVFKSGAGFRIELSASTGALTKARQLDGLDLALPLLRLTRTDGLPVPAISSLQVAVQDAPGVAYSTQTGIASITAQTFPFGKPAKPEAAFCIMSADWIDKGEVNITLSPQWVYGASTYVRSSVEVFLQTGDAISGLANSPLQSLSTPVRFAAAFPSRTVPAQASVADPAGVGQSVRVVLKKTSVTADHDMVWKSLRVDYEWREQNLSQQFLWERSGYVAAQSLKREPDAEMFLGFEGISPGQDISLYWRLRSTQRKELAWSYLGAHQQWQSLDGEVRDGTDGLFRSGMWQAALPPDASPAGTESLPGNRYWLRASIWRGSGLSYPATQDFLHIEEIRTNAAYASFVPNDAQASELPPGLPAQSITGPLKSVDGLAEVAQPWPSEGGRAAESTADMMQRAARQLAHRGRALSWKDIEILLMARYPEIRGMLLPDIQAGAVDAAQRLAVVLLPAFGRHDNNDALRPAFNAARLADMRTYLSGISSPWLDSTLDLVNPRYADVQLDYDVEFKPGVNRDYGNRQLCGALARHYMSWSEQDQAIAPGNSLDYYGVVAFIQRQDFVQRVRSLTLNGLRQSIAAADAVLVLLCAPAAATGKERD